MNTATWLMSIPESLREAPRGVCGLAKEVDA
jgi:hypothetical protein